MEEMQQRTRHGQRRQDQGAESLVSSGLSSRASGSKRARKENEDDYGGDKDWDAGAGEPQRKPAQQAATKNKRNRQVKEKRLHPVLNPFFVPVGVAELQDQCRTKLIAAGMSEALVGNVMSHFGLPHDKPQCFDQDVFDQDRTTLLSKASLLEHYAGCAEDDLFMSKDRISGDAFAESGLPLSPIVIMCKECLTNKLGAHDNNGGFKCEAFGLEKLPQTMFNYVNMVRSLDDYKAAFTFDNILLKPLSSSASKNPSMEDGKPGLGAAKLVVEHNRKMGVEFFIGMGKTAGPGCTNVLKNIAATTKDAQWVTIDIDFPSPFGNVTITVTVVSFSDRNLRPLFSVQSERHLSKVTSTPDSLKFIASVIPFALTVTGRHCSQELCQQLAMCLLDLPKTPPPFDSDTAKVAGKYLLYSTP